MVCTSCFWWRSLLFCQTVVTFVLWGGGWRIGVVGGQRERSCLHAHRHIHTQSRSFLALAQTHTHTLDATSQHLLLHVHTPTHWMLRHRIFFCTCPHWMLRHRIFSCTYTHWMLRRKIFSSTCTHIGCYTQWVLVIGSGASHKNQK